ncbi:MAG: arylesterase [Desulfobacteraceae bacterium]|jgi:acyl-CoA thioesterase-1
MTLFFLRSAVSLTVAGLALALGGCSEPEAPPAPAPRVAADAPETIGTIVAVGDSLTAGYGLDEEEAYPAQLARMLAEAGLPYRVVNAGISGETSSGALSRIEWVLVSLKPDIVILATGANDGLRGTDPALTRENLRRSVQILKADGVVVVLAGMQMVRNMGRQYTESFAEIFAQVAAEEEVLLVPFLLAGVAGEAQLNQADGIHPTAAGYQVVAENVFPYVRRAIAVHQAQQSGAQ